MSTRSYFSRFILFTAPTPSTATSIVHPNICKNLLDTFLLTASSSTKSTLGGTAHPGTYVDLLTLSVCALPGLPLPADEPAAEADEGAGALMNPVGPGTAAEDELSPSSSGSPPMPSGVGMTTWLRTLASNAQFPFASSSDERGIRWPTVNTCSPSWFIVLASTASPYRAASSIRNGPASKGGAAPSAPAGTGTTTEGPAWGGGGGAGCGPGTGTVGLVEDDADDAAAAWA